MTEWDDATTYSRGERGVIEPTAWSATVDGVHIYITKKHLRAPGEWVMHCAALGMDTVQLGLSADQPVDLAKTVAKNMAAHRARQIAIAIGKM